MHYRVLDARERIINRNDMIAANRRYNATSGMRISVVSTAPRPCLARTLKQSRLQAKPGNKPGVPRNIVMARLVRTTGFQTVPRQLAPTSRAMTDADLANVR